MKFVNFRINFSSGLKKTFVDFKISQISLIFFLLVRAKIKSVPCTLIVSSKITIDATTSNRPKRLRRRFVRVISQLIG